MTSSQQARTAALVASDGPDPYTPTCTLRVTGTDLEALARTTRDVLAACRPAAPEPRLRVRPDGDALLLELALPCLAADARTLDLLAHAIAARLTAPDAPLPDPDAYPRVSAWLRGLQQQDPAAGERWQRAARAPDRLGLPIALAPTGPFAPRAHTVAPACLPALRGLADALATTPEVVALTAWAALCARLLGRPDLTIGVVCDGRGWDELADLPGPLARQLPLALSLPPDASFAAHVADVARRLDAARDAQDLFDPGAHGSAELTPLAFEAAAPLLRISAGPLRFIGLVRTAHVDRFELKLELRPDACLLHHDAARVDPVSAARLAEQLATLIAAAAAAPNVPLRDLDPVGPAEAAWQRSVLDAPAGPAARSVLERLADHVASRPAQLAVVDPWTRLSYQQLDRAADALADALRAARCRTVAIVAERSAACVVAMIAAMRAHAIWVPLERAHPPARLRQLVARTGATLVVHDASSRPALGVAAIAVDRHGAIAGAIPVDPPPRTSWTAPDPGLTAYIVFTSGSTGAPKGVCVSHGALASYADAVTRALDLDEAPVMAAISSLATDLSFTAVFGALVTGGTLLLCGEQLADDADGLARFLSAGPSAGPGPSTGPSAGLSAGPSTGPSAGLTPGPSPGPSGLDVLKIVPSQLAALLDAAAVPGDLLPRRRLILGGEAPDPALVARVRALAPTCEVHNHYGPTEATVGVSVARLAPGGAAFPGTRPPIGRPLARVRLHILDPDLRPVPSGATGELYIAGDSLALGYHDQPGPTADRFLPDPFSDRPGARIYRTGDRARLLAHGEVQLLGREDDQVKVHGVRIELGEVEAQLRPHPRVAECAVVRHPDTGGLVAWLVPAPGADIDPDELARELAEQLPREHIPTRWFVVHTLPRTASGKLDRRALMATPLPAGPTSAAPSSAATSPTERLLAAIWREVLRRPGVGLHDSFFALGGDSITSIAVVARARRAGLRLSVRDIFDHPTLAALAAAADRLRTPDLPAAPVDGPFPLTPSQAWLRGLGSPAPDFFNQALAVGLPAAPDRAHLERALQLVAAHHEALHLRIDLARGQQQVDAPTWPLTWLDLHDDPDPASALANALDALHRGLDLAAGRLLQALVATPGRDCPAELFLVAHHACIDTVSWRIVLEDLEHALTALEAGHTPVLPVVPTPLSRWVRALHDEAARLDPDAPREPPQQPQPPRPDAPRFGTVGATVTLTLPLDPLAARALLRWGPALHGARLDQLLLAAAAQALSQGTGRDRLEIEVEGHGRAPLAGLDPSRIVGWLTARHPLHLAGDRRDDLSAWVATTRDALARVADGGRGHGLRTWLHDHPQALARRAADAPDLAFNYLGAVTAGLADSRFVHVRAAPGPARHPGTPRSAPLELLVSHDEHTLVLAWTYAADAPTAATHSACAHAARDALDALGRRICAHDPDDAVAEICELAPMQEGMLADCLAARDPGLYIAHTTLSFAGDLDPAVMARAWRSVLARHSALRTALLWEDLPRPVQVVHRRVELPLSVVDRADPSAAPGLDLRAVACARLEQITAAPLVHITLARLGEARWDMLFSRHHLVLDGWSAAIVLREVLHTYALERAGQTSAALGEGSHYPRWVRALHAQGRTDDDAFWRAELDGYPGGPLLPAPPPAGHELARRGPQGQRRRALAPALRRPLAELLQRADLTSSSLVQALYALVLARGSGRDDLVFGVTSAGRSLQLEGIERMVGLLINTLPLRARLADHEPLLAWACALQAARVRVEEHHATSLRTLQRLVPRAPLLDTIVVGGNYPVDPSNADDIGGLRLTAVDTAVENSLPLTLRVDPGGDFTLEFLHDRARFAPAWVDQRLDELHALVAWLVADPTLTVGALRARLAARPAWCDPDDPHAPPPTRLLADAQRSPTPDPVRTREIAVCLDPERLANLAASTRDITVPRASTDNIAVPRASTDNIALAAPCLAASLVLLAGLCDADPLHLAVGGPAAAHAAHIPACAGETFAALVHRVADLLAHDPPATASPVVLPLAVVLTTGAPLGPPGAAGRTCELRWDLARGRVSLAYDAAALSPAHAELMATQLRAVLHAAAATPTAELAALMPVDPGPAPADSHAIAPTISHALTRCAGRWPDRPALSSDALQLTHAGLDRLATAIARTLVARGLRPGDIVGLEHPGPEVLPLFHGVLRAGGVVLPLSRRDPRLTGFLADAGARLLITDDPLARPGATPVLPARQLLDAAPAHAPLPPLSAADLAWLVYTSGSTGQPRGVLIDHGAAMHYATALCERLAAPEGARWGALASFAVDLGYSAWLGALASGGCTHIFPVEAALDPERFAAALALAPLDFLKIVPSHLEALLGGSADPAQLLPRRGLLLGGEAMTWSLVDRARQLAPACAVFNHYGPSETTIGVLAGRVDDDPHRGPRPPLGHPLPGVRFDLLDPRGRPVPSGSPGELYIGGPTVGCGYHGRPEATAERFLPDPHGPPGARRYRTGDRARREPDGRLVFLGRCDDQLKIRGHRVEPAEVEVALARLRGVRQVRVILERDASDARLVAYAVADGPPRPPGELLHELAASLPAHMIPADLQWLAALPWTVGGKLDRQALLATPPHPRPADPAPLTLEEQALLHIWEAVLSRRGVAVDDNFFACGGDSLRAIQLTARLRTTFQVKVPVQLVFEHPTPAAMARALLALPDADRVRRTARVLARVRGTTGDPRP